MSFERSRAGNGRRGRARRLPRRRAAGARRRRASSICAPSANVSLEPAARLDAGGHDLRSLVADQAAGHRHRHDAAGARGQAPPRRPGDALLPQLRRATGRRTSPSATCSATPPGWPAWRPFYKDILQIERQGGKVNFLGSDGGQGVRLPGRSAASGPRRRRARAMLYSDLGFILLGAVVEEVSGTTARPLLPGAHLPSARHARDVVHRSVDGAHAAPRAGHRDDRRRPSAARGASAFCAARCTTTTPTPWAASPDTPGCSPSARDVDTLLCRLKACCGGRGRRSSRSASCASSGRATRAVPELDLGAGLGHAVADQLVRPARCSRPTPSAISASPALRSGWTSTATATSSC